MRTPLTEFFPRKIGWSIALLLAMICTGSSQLQAQLGACDSISVSANYRGPGCCWDFVLTNSQTFQFFNSITATVLSPTGSVVSASGGFPATTGPITADWAFPNNIQKGKTTISGCFKSNTGVIKLLFEWKYQGQTLCRDTIELDCPGGPTDDTCSTDSLRISTGWDPYTNGLHSVGDYTSFWQVIADPSPSTTEPRPASVIAKHSAWSGPLGTSRWISSYPSASNDTNGTYVFQTCFCVKQGARNVRLIFDILADDRARVYINGIQVGGTPLSWGFLSPANHVDTNITAYVKPGRNCIRVEVDNTNSVAMGLDIDGYITADGIGLERSVCCDRDGILTGAKFWDKNCDGKRNPGEPGIPGWTIVLSNGDTAITDALGNYYFTGLVPGPYMVSEMNQPGWTQSYPTAPGIHNVLLNPGQVIGNLDFGNCKQEPPKECIEYRPDTTLCEREPGTNFNHYVHKFMIRSDLPCQFSTVASVTVLSPAAVGVSPSSFPVSGSWSGQSIVINGPGAVAGAVVVLQVKVCCVFIDPSGQVGDTLDCCYDTIRVVLPECPGNQDCPDCCKEFPKQFFKLTQWTSSSGYASVGGYVQAGSSPICTVSATLVDVHVNGQPVFGQFLPVNWLSTTAGTIPYMHEVVWTGVDVSTGPTPFKLRLQFPGMAWSSFTDRVDYCIRFRFTDKNCVTCDTVICFKQRRFKWIFPADDIIIRGKSETKGATSLGSAAPSLSGSLTGPEAGKLEVTFPTPPAELGQVRYVGLEVYPAEEFVEITGATSSDHNYTIQSFGAVSEAFEAAAGTSTSVDLTYFGLNNRKQLDHWVTVRFVLPGSPNDTLEETGRVTFYRADLIGGDELRQEKFNEETKTYALYLHNKNGSAEPISRLTLRTEEGVKILAVGPGPSENLAVIAFSSDISNAQDAAAFDLDGSTTTIAPDGMIGPIYVTLSGATNSTDLEFATLNDRGNVISEGVLSLVDNPSSIHDGGSAGTAGGVLLQGAFPNPTAESATLRVMLPRSEDQVTLSIVDAAGREVLRLLDGVPLRAGDHALYIDAADMPTGTYFITLQAGDHIETTPLQIRR
ncbi:MAG: SdrD B-like domain-containing protein [Candidatus Kapaibacterium sp.]